MPTQQGIGLCEEPMELPPGEQPAESREERSVAWLQSRTYNLAPENRHLMAEHDDFDGEIVSVTSSETDQLERPDEGEIQEREGHGPFSRSRRSQ